MKKLGNVLTGLLHIAGLFVLAGMCLIKYIKVSDPLPIHPLYDAQLIIASVAMIVIHYFVFERFFQNKIRTCILSIFEVLFAIAFLLLILIPNDLLSIHITDGVIVMIVQLLIVSARVFSVVKNYQTSGEFQNV